MTATRRLAAIRAADVAGYSRLIGLMKKAPSTGSGQSGQRLSIQRSRNTEAASSKRLVMVSRSNFPVWVTLAFCDPMAPRRGQT
jgi:hypothetical protein